MAHERLFGTASPFDGVHEIVLDQSFHAAYHVDIVEPEIGIAHDHAFARKREPYSEVGGERGLAHAAFPRCYDDFSCHILSSAHW